MCRRPICLTYPALATLVALCLVFPGDTLRAFIINVPADHPTVQEGIDAANDGDTVLVAPGTYYENVNFNRKEIVLTSHFMFEMNPEFIANTILNGSTPNLPDSASVVRITGVADSTTILQGFTITGGKGTKWLTPGYPGNPATLGGGILIDTASPAIQYNLIVDNEALIEVSSLSAGGGGIRSGFGSPIIRNNIILNNRGLYGGGIVLNFPTGGHIANNVIADNKGGVSFGGGAMWLGFGFGITIVNNTIVGNSSGYLSGGIEVIGSGLKVKNTILWGNVGTSPDQVTAGPTTVSYCLIQGGRIGTGNINADPSLYGTYRYHVPPSPCIDAGDPASPLFDDIDNPATPGTAKWPSRGSLRNDIGAYGGPNAFAFDKVFAMLLNNGIGAVPNHASVEAHTSEPITNIHWDFGNGNPDYNLVTSHVFPAWGEYPIALKGDTGLGSLSTLFLDTAYAIADSLKASSSEASPGQPVAVEIVARNAPPLYNMVVPIQWTGDLELQFDSISRAGCRTDFFNVMSFLSFDLGMKSLAVRLQNSTLGTGTELGTGTGVVLRYWFTIPTEAAVGQTASISLAGYGMQQPIFKSTMLSYPSTLTYRPETVAGSITVISCCKSRGDVNYDSLHKRNVLDVTYLVAYLFQGGVEPPCDESADVNGDASVNVVDIIYLVQYLFRFGSQPPACP